MSNLRDNEKKIEQLASISIRGNIIINAPTNAGKLYANFLFQQPDSLKIQFRDPIGRKQALMSFFDEKFELWLQREKKHLGRDEIPADFSLFIFRELSLSDIRKLFLGRPLFDFLTMAEKREENGINSITQKGTKIITKFYPEKTIKSVEIFSEKEKLSSIFNYSHWQSIEGIFFPSDIQIIDLDRGVELKIKLYHFSLEYFNLSGL